MRWIFIVQLFLVCHAAVGQVQTHVVPPVYDAVDAPDMLWLGGMINEDLHQQILIDQSLLVSMRGKSIRGVTLRRDVGVADALLAGSAALNLRMSTAARPVQDPSVFMKANRGGDEVLVFSGAVTMPASPAYQVGHYLWRQSNCVHVVFQVPFAYVSGDLCLEVTGQPVSGMESPRWMLDAFFPLDAGVVTNHGTSVARVAASSGSSGERITSGVSGRDLVVGGTASFYALGTPRASAFFVLGVGLLPTPLNLGVVGSPQSNLYVAPVVSLPTSFGDLLTPLSAAEGGTAMVDLKLPADSSFMGAVLAGQWIEFDMALPEFLTSNAVLAQVASTRPSILMSIVTGMKDSTGLPPTTGRIDIGMGHVIKFDYQ